MPIILLFLGFWAVVSETDFSKLEPGVAYKLVPTKQNPEYPWIIDEKCTAMLPNTK